MPEDSSADSEPSLGSPEGVMDQTRWAFGGVQDREYYPADEGEPDHDNEATAAGFRNPTF